MITVFTPSYNREHNLKNLYKSLISQTSNDFEWLIVDDGSQDHTKELVDEFISLNKIKIRYVYQENQGKHIAFNTAIELAKGDMFICVDSDDSLTKDAIETIKKDQKNISEKDAGLIYISKYAEDYGQNLWKSLHNRKVDIIDLKELYGITESAIVFNTNILKKYRFPLIIGKGTKYERFCSEGLLYNQLVGKAKFLVKNKLIYFGYYQSDGLTRNLFKKTWISSPYSVIEDFKLRYKIAGKYMFITKYKIRFKAIMNINALCMKSKISIMSYTPSKIGSFVLYIPSVAFKIFRF